MGKKKKSGKKSGKKKGGKKKSAEPQITWKEALLAYKINIKDSQIQDAKYELRCLEEKNQRHQERNKRLKSEQSSHMKNLLKQNKDFQKKLDSEPVVEKDEVIKVMQEKWEVERQEKRHLQELRQQIRSTDATINQEKKRVEYWHEYEHKGQHEHSTQIQLLEKELIDMQNTFDEMAAHLENDLKAAKSEIKKKTDEKLDKQKHLASEKAMARMDKYSRQEVLDNDWLKREVEIHKHEAAELMAAVGEMERENLEMMSELFECHVDDLKISRNFYLTQFAEGDDVDEGLLEMDLSRLSINQRDEFGNLPLVSAAIKQESEKSSRPKSAKLQYMEDKVLSLVTREQALANEDNESDYDGDNDAESSGDEDPFNNYFHFDDEDFDDYLKLGPLELKLLNVSGQQMPIHKPRTPGPEEMRTKQFKPDLWPVKKSMLKTAVK